MHTLDVIDSALQWESERQNRLHQQALDLKKKQARDDGPADHAPAPSAAAGPVPGWPDKVSRVPDMRSALIPLDESTEGSDWSKPFALTKADIEPWTSFLAGYNQSRLFLQPASAAASTAAALAQDPARIDFAVRALFALKRIPARLIVEPPVQINRQVEYHDLESELRASQGRLRPDTVLKLALELHQKQLAKAVEKGRQLGDDLYEAMMGEGYCNLVAAWVRAYGRKPSVEELHGMLSTGRVKPFARTAAPAPEQRTVPAAPQAETPQQAPVSVQAAQPLPRAAVVTGTDDDDEDDDESAATVTLGGAASASASRKGAPGQAAAKPRQSRRILWYLLHAAATASSAAAVAFFWLN